MRFWHLVKSGRIGTAWKHLSRRPDSEHEQALIRMAATALIFVYLYWSVNRDGSVDRAEQILLWTCGLYHLVSVGLFLVIVRSPGVSPFRRYLAAVGDLGLTSFGISLVGEAGAPLYVVLLWVIFGNGFRYGRRYLFVSSALGSLGFGAAFITNPYWNDKHVMGVGLQIGTVILPLYVSSLLKKLTAAAQRAEEANRAKNRFLANMSHEMRTPLNGIIGLIDLLRGTPMTGEQEELAKAVDASARSLLFLMQDVLDLSKIEAGKVSVQIADFDLHELAKNTVAIMEPLARTKGLEMFLNVPANVPFLLRGDPLLLQQVLLNLLGNAVKFTERGDVGVRVFLESESADSAAIRFEVVDTGIGIAPEALRRIFERFAQADESITRRYGGTGLGTTISKEIIEMMGGKIGVHSTQGAGSTFWFSIELEKGRAGGVETALAPVPVDRTMLFSALHPSRPDAAAGDSSVGNIAEKYRQRQAGRRKLRVLVAEDNRTNQMVFAKILERAGHEVVLVGNGEQALDELKSRSFDITLMDLHMPVMGGIEAAKLYRFMNRASPRMPIVALTADATQEAQAECEDAGIEACLIKPVDTRKLLELLDQLVPGGASAAVAPTDTATDDGPGATGPENGECLDIRVLQELSELGSSSDFVARLVWTFLKGSREKIRELERTVSDGDAEGARRAAHALKGNSGQIGAFALMRACDRFSGIGVLELQRNGRGHCAAVQDEFSRVRTALNRQFHLSEPAAS